MGFVQHHVRIVEVGPRDGLQNIKTAIPTATKIELIRRLHAVGLQNIELTSIVSPKAIPQLADSQKVLGDSSIQRLIAEPSLCMTVLVPNVRGFDMALKHGVKDIAVFVSATERFSKANINCTVDEGLRRAAEVAALAAKHSVRVRGYVSCIFEDPFDGLTPVTAVLHAVKRLLDIGCYEISLGDTTGAGTATSVRRLLTFLFEHGVPAERLAGHFHDTYGQAVSNVWTAFELGLRTFDSSVGGLGGCPYAGPTAKGNVATEDLVYLFEGAGVSTGTDIRKLSQVGAWICNRLSKTNDSRAGAALARKHSSSMQQASSIRKQPVAKLEWVPTHSATNDVQILRSGENINILLNRAKTANALAASMVRDISHFFERASTDNTISRIVITPKGNIFGTGMDLGQDSSVAKSEQASEEQYKRLTRLVQVTLDASQVTVAAVNGPAYGGDVGLAFACDARAGAAGASLTLGEVKLGLSSARIRRERMGIGIRTRDDAQRSACPIPPVNFPRLRYSNGQRRGIA